MCGRFTLTSATEQITTLFDAVDSGKGTDEIDRPRFNIAPTQPILVIRNQSDSAGTELVAMRWGLIPSWAGSAKGSNLVNARCETIAELPSFRAAFQKRRCLIPTDGFYEWMRDGDRKRAYWIHRPNEEMFTFAGIWETGSDQTESCAVVTTAANQLLQPLHTRMPVIVPSEWRQKWLDPKTPVSEFKELFQPAPEDWLVLRPVSSLVNSARVDSPRCVEAVELPTERQLTLWSE
jgi:putative SOS response-associated peptidase YedK